MRQLLAALRLLTILPVPGDARPSKTELSGSVLYFPAAGLVLGALAAAAAWFLAEVTPTLITAALVVALLALLSGGRTLEGLYGTFAHVDVDRAAPASASGRSGAKGAAAVTLILLLKVAAVASIPWDYRWAAVLLMPMAGRMSMCFLLASLPARREDPVTMLNRNLAAPGAALGLALLAAASYTVFRWRTHAWLGVFLCMASLGVAILLASYVAQKIRGATLDTLGAACELGELVPAMTLAVWAYRLDPVAIFLLK